VEKKQLDAYMLSGPWEPITPYTIVDPDRLRQEIDLVRKNGYATNDSEFAIGVVGAAVPIAGPSGRIIACLSISAPTARKSLVEVRLLVPMMQAPHYESPGFSGSSKATLSSRARGQSYHNGSVESGARAFRETEVECFLDCPPQRQHRGRSVLTDGDVSAGSDRDAVTIQHFDPTIVICAMKYLLASTLAAVIATAGTAATAETSGSSDTPKQECAMGYVTGVGGSAQSVREYLATPDRDRYRYLADHPIQCQISDEGRASACTGITTLQHEKISVYDDTDNTTMAVVTRVELDRGTYTAIIVVPRQDVQCGE
jgi:hypothetical protein